MEITLDSSSSPEDPLSRLEQDIEFFKSENQLLRRFLQRVAPEALQAVPSEAGQQEAGALLIGEKNEICTQEVEACSRELETSSASSAAQQAHLAAAVAECKLQMAETRRDAHELLKLLGLQPGNAVALAPTAADGGASPRGEQQGMEPAAPGESSSTAAGNPPSAGLSSAADTPPADPGQPVDSSWSSSWSSSSNSIGNNGGSKNSNGHTATQVMWLPSMRQLEQAGVPGVQVEKFLEELLRRQELAVERLHMRGGMLKGQLAKLETQLATKLEMGGTLQQVDYEQLKIQHAQAQDKLDKHNADCVVLKSDMGLAMQVLADLRNSLSSTAGEGAALQRQILAAGKQLDVLRAGVAGVQAECNALAKECDTLRREKRGAGEGEAAQIMDYIKVKTEVQEAQKKIADYQRKIEVASLTNKSKRPA